MTTTFRISPDLELPERFATEGVVVMGVRGSGKSNTEVRFAELLFEASVPFVAIDPKGDWYGVRMAGTGPGLPVPVFGGLHGDFPLDERLGARIADLLVDENLSAILDVSRLAKTSALPTFLIAFFNQLMERHQEEPHVRCVIMEEAHRYIPQVVKGNMAVLKEAAAAVLLEGRSFGLGCWACTQRPARLHNDVLEECDTAVIHRIGVTATADLKRVRDWVKHEDLGDEIGASLTKLANGEAWILSPSSLGIVQRIKVGRRTTFDSGATPLVGAAARRPQSTMADIDAPAVTQALSDAIEKAKADDPKELRRRIADLEKSIATLEAAPAPEPEPVDVEVWPEGLNVALLDLEGHARALIASVQATLTLGADLPAATGIAATATTASASPSARSKPSSAPAAARAPRPAAGGTAGALPGPQRKLLTVLAVYGPRTKRQLAMQAGYSHKGGGFNNPLSALRSAGLVERGDPIAITQAGLDALGDYEPLPTGQALIDHWFATLGGPERKILQPLIDVWPTPMSKDDLAAAAGYDPSGGGFNNPLSRLRSLELVRRGTDIALTDDFAEAIR